MNRPAPLQPQPTSAWSMYRSIVGIGAFCALIIVIVYQATADRIRENQERFLAKAAAEVLPAANRTVPVALSADGGLELASGSGELPAFLGYDPSDRLVGAVIAAQGMGYQDNIRVLYAYSFDQDAIVGFKILDSKETPGLGDRVEKEPHFIANFERLDVSLDDGGTALANPIVTVKQGQKTGPWQLDGITGATITSEAIGNLLNESASRWVPALERDAARFAEISGTEVQ